MPLGAVLRQLPTLTRKDVLKPMSKELALVTKRLTDAEEIKKARLHPIQILLALKTYASGGRYSRGTNTWTPVSQVTDALNDAFYLAFANVEPTGKRFLLGIDVSPSMHGAHVNDSNLTSAEAVGALSLVISKTEPQTHTVAFASAATVGYGRPRHERGVVPMDISHNRRLDDVISTMRQTSRFWGGTDAALPIKYALENKIVVDVFVTLTDNDTWAGNKHVHEALAEYRKALNPQAKLVVLATSPSGFSIADPNDPLGQLDIAGFDSAVPQILSEFAKGF
jgi:60 kDa SS-A/Ro ribonucleoprotein